jgi:teichuronic acid biosynthesis glycosyltransferase TuaC
MKVLVVSHLYPSPGHDRHLFVHEQVKALAALGVDMHVLSPTGYAPRPLWRLDPRLRRRGTTPRRAERDGIVADYPRVVVLPRRLLYPRIGEIFDLTLRRRVPELRAAGYDLVHAHQALPDGAAAARLAAALGVPYVVTVHGADVYQHLRGGGGTAAAAAEVLRGAAAVMGVSSSVTRLLEPVVSGPRVHVVHNGTLGAGEPVEPADFLPGEPLVLSVGYLIERKGHAVVLEALARLARERGGSAAVGDAASDASGTAGERRPPHYAIVGEGPLRESLEAKAAELGLAQRVHFLGRRPHAEVLALMARADVFALPSWDEAFGLVYTEAMTQATPTVACSGEGPEDFIDDGVSGFLVPARDAAALAAAFARVFDDPGAAAAVGAAGRAAAAGLTWVRNAAAQKAIYEAVLGGPVRNGSGETTVADPAGDSEGHEGASPA